MKNRLVEKLLQIAKRSIIGRPNAKDFLTWIGTIRPEAPTRIDFAAIVSSEVEELDGKSSISNLFQISDTTDDSTLRRSALLFGSREPGGCRDRARALCGLRESFLAIRRNGGRRST